MSDSPTPIYDAPPPSGQPFNPDPVPPPKQKMSQGKKIGLWTGGVVAGLIVIGAVAPKDPAAGPTAPPAVAASSSTTSEAGNFPTVDRSVQASLDAEAAKRTTADAAAAKTAAADAVAKKKATDAAAAKKAVADKAAAAEQALRDAMTAPQKQAGARAEEYLEHQSFSRRGLIKQLESEGFSTADATIGVDYLTVDWNKQAEAKAKEHLEHQSFSRRDLIEQLRSEGFTRSQTTRGVDSTGL